MPGNLIQLVTYKLDKKPVGKMPGSPPTPPASPFKNIFQLVKIKMAWEKCNYTDRYLL